MNQVTRRRFLEDSLLAAAAAAIVPNSLLAAENRQQEGRDPKLEPLRVAVVGVRGRGRAHIKAFKDSPDAEVVALCEVDSAVLGPAQRAAPKAKVYRDLRKLLEDESIDVVSIATPNHWHALGAAWSLAAGKHVYVEKPISHDFMEGRMVVEAAAKYGKLCQHGTQARSYRATREAIAWLQGGGLGKVHTARGLCYKRRTTIGKVEGDQVPPKTLDYDLWTGPAAMAPLRRKNLHYDWHWVFNTGNGDLGNQGIHQLDIARWGLNQASFPKAVQSIGGRFGYDDDGNTPNTMVTSFDYGEQQMLFEVRGLKTSPYRKTNVGVIFHCEGGYLASASYGKVVAFDKKGEVIKVFSGGGNHFQNFLNAVRSGKKADLHAESLEGHISSGLAHLGNISYLLGQSKSLSGASFDDPRGGPSHETLDQMRAHLAQNDVDPTKVEALIGPRLQFDPSTERFQGTGAKEANAKLIGSRRAPFLMPKLG